MEDKYLEFLCKKYSCASDLLLAGYITDWKWIAKDLKKEFKLSKSELDDIKFECGFF